MSRQSPTPRYDISAFDRIILPGGRTVTIVKRTDTGYQCRPFGSDLSEHITYEAFEAARQHPHYRHDPNYYTVSTSQVRAYVGIESSDQIPAEEMPSVIWREHCVRAALDLAAQDREKPPYKASQRVNMTARGLAAAMRRASPDLMQLDVARRPIKHVKPNGRKAAATKPPAPTKSGRPRKVRAGQTITLRSLPSPRTLHRWIKAYEAANGQRWGLRQCHCRCGNYEDRFEPEEYAVLLDAVRAYLDLKRPTYRACYEAYGDALTVMNTQRVERGQQPLRRIGFSTYRAHVQRIPLFQRDAARHGVTYAMRRRGGVKRSFEVTRIGELVQVDGCKVSLMTLCIETGAWDMLTPEQRKLVPRDRWTLLRAIDVASRCTLAAVFTPSETTEAAVALLRMMLVDKTPIAVASGAKTPWHYACCPYALVSDAGSAFRSDRFRQVLADLGIKFEAPRVGQPNKRTHVERSFGTDRTRFLSMFSGQTFANVGDKGDYDPKANASLFIDELARAHVLYEVDVYHNTPHQGLRGETPRAAWQRLMEEGGCSRGTPGAHQQRGIFGILLSRTLGKRGVRVLGLHYQSADLAKLLADKGEVDVHVRVDPDDLGWVSVQVDGVWKTIRCATSGLDGATITQWLAVVGAERRGVEVHRAASRPVVAEALRRIRTIAARAERRLSILPHVYDPALIARKEAELLHGFTVPEDATRPEASPGNDPLIGGIPITGPEVEPHASPPTERVRPRATRSPEPPPPSPEDDSDDDSWIKE